MTGLFPGFERRQSATLGAEMNLMTGESTAPPGSVLAIIGVIRPLPPT
jgi:hypothetical protein